MTFRSKSILPDGFRTKPIIIKVLDYVFGDFKEPIGRKTYSLLATRSCLVIIIIIIFLFLTPFLENAWTDFHEIFRDGVYWSSLAENIFFVMTSLPVRY